MKKQVLVVEDEPNIIASLIFLFEHAGFEVLSQGDGKIALEQILSSPPDVLVLDVMLPGMDGFEVLRHLRSNPKTRTLPVLMLTAKGQREDRKNALDYGADLFITKPFSNADVVSAVTKLATQEKS